MWTKTIETKFKGVYTQVQIWLAETTENNKEMVRVQSMVNEYYLIEEILFEDRDSAYDFIKHYPNSMAIAFLNRVAYSFGAV